MENLELKAAKYLNETMQTKKKRKDTRIEAEYFDEIEITDPMTGKKSMHKVKVTRYKSAVEKQIGQKGISEELESNEELNYEYDTSNEEVDE
ncbi:hypothetical protein UFOVP53_83 [uncultured Caudovirales phage]|uniref:Uncharacterized protein n=1 Tax=uncultured Caudovirales phage TaxID=2100421 RepID=A0A6J5KZ46_9CAUD|nr:hypothetical protein UFOVP53_83 [uncultured Caudovirales phage]